VKLRMTREAQDDKGSSGWQEKLRMARKAQDDKNSTGDLRSLLVLGDDAGTIKVQEVTKKG